MHNRSVVDVKERPSTGQVSGYAEFWAWNAAVSWRMSDRSCMHLLMARVICISNQKGGVGKTTTAINLAASLAAADKSTLLIDFDPQGNAGSGLGSPAAEDQPGVYEWIAGQAEFDEVVLKTELKNLEVMPATANLAGLEVELVGVDDREFVLKSRLAPLRKKYDYILIDCPPSLGLLTINALAAADGVLVPLQTEYFALEGLAQLMKTIEIMKESINPELSVDGIVLTMFDARANINRQVADEVRKSFGKIVFETEIPRNVKLAEAPSFGKPILLYDVTSKGCEAYLSLGKEVVKRRRRLGAA